jgi:hypothetical protein
VPAAVSQELCLQLKGTSRNVDEGRSSIRRDASASTEGLMIIPNNRSWLISFSSGECSGPILPSKIFVASPKFQAWLHIVFQCEAIVDFLEGNRTPSIKNLALHPSV